MLNLFLFLTFFGAGYADGNTGFSETGSEPYTGIRSAILNFRFTEAEQLIKKAPVPYLNAFYQVQITAWQYLITEQNERIPVFDTRLESAMDLIESQPETAERAYLLGDLQMWKAIVRMRSEEYVSAAWSGRSAMNHYKEAAELDPKNPDIRKGTGTMKYVAGAIPSRLTWLASIFGLNGSMAEGIRDLEWSARFGTVSSAESRFFLSAIELFTNRNPEKSIAHLDTLLTQYPGNGVFVLMKAVALQRDKQVPAAVALMEKEYTRFRDTMPAFSDVIRFRIAEGYYFMNRFDKAIPLFEDILAKFKGNSLRRLGHFRLGLSYELTGRRKEALAQYRKIEPNENNDFDLYMVSESERWAQTPMSDAEKKAWLGRNYFDAGFFKEAAEQYRLAMELAGKDTRLIAETHFRLGRLADHQKQTDQAVREYQLAIKLCPPDHEWIRAQSLFHLGKMEADAGRKASALAWYAKADEMEDHLFVNSLHREIDTERKRLDGK
ncbi:MAG: DUF3808 domain-containing protein [Bacteroidetes bacterium]|nr:DUF3808 domain-containing protein [Bacteroidota bacterium]